MRGDTIRQRGHKLRMRGGQRSVSEGGLQNDIEYYQPEVLMFSRGQKLLYMNGRESGVTGRLDHAAPLRELRNAIQAGLDLRRAANIWEPFELKRVLFEGGRRILVRGLGLSDRSPHDDSRIVIVIEELGFQHEAGVLEGEMKGLFQARRKAGDSGGSRRGDNCGVSDAWMVERCDTSR